MKFGSGSVKETKCASLVAPNRPKTPACLGLVKEVFL